MIRSNSINVDPSSINLIENTLKKDILNTEITEILNINTKNVEDNVSEETK